MATCSPNRLLIAGLLSAAVAYMYGVYKQRDYKPGFNVEEALISSWRKIMQAPSLQFNKVLVGFNSDVDLIVSGTKLLHKLNAIPSLAKPHVDINTLQEMEEAFAHSFSRGLPAERYIQDPKLFDQLVNTVETKMTKYEAAIGGNAALIAQNVAENFEHVKLVLVGPIGPRLRALLHPRISMQNSTVIPRDEIHLIMEFRHGETWGDYVAPSYSRFITSHDYFSGSTIVIEMLFNTIPAFRPDLIVLTGAHLLEFQTPELWMEKLALIKRNLSQAKRKIPIHLELGHMWNETFVEHVMVKVLPFVDSLALSEQELMILSHVGGGPYAEDFPMKSTTIHPHKATEILNWLLLKFGQSTDVESKQRHYRLQRVHVQSLTFHMIATRGPDWSNGAASLAAGALASAQSACGSAKSIVNTNSLELRVDEVLTIDRTTDRKYRFNSLNPIHSWMRDEVLFIYTPVLLCKHPAKTVGLAQAVDAAALMYSQFFKLHD